MWKKSQSRGFREGRSGYSKHNFFPPHAWKKNQLKVDWTFELLLDPLLTISPNLFFWKELSVISLQSK